MNNIAEVFNQTSQAAKEGDPVALWTIELLKRFPRDRYLNQGKLMLLMAEKVQQVVRLSAIVSLRDETALLEAVEIIERLVEEIILNCFDDDGPSEEEKKSIIEARERAREQYSKTGLVDDLKQSVINLPSAQMQKIADSLEPMRGLATLISQFFNDTDLTAAIGQRNLQIRAAIQGKRAGPTSGLDKRYENNRRAETHVLEEWARTADQYDSKAHFSRVQAALLKKSFDLAVSPSRIADVWLKGKKHPGKRSPS